MEAIPIVGTSYIRMRSESRYKGCEAMMRFRKCLRTSVMGLVVAFSRRNPAMMKKAGMFMENHDQTLIHGGKPPAWTKMTKTAKKTRAPRTAGLTSTGGGTSAPAQGGATRKPSWA